MSYEAAAERYDDTTGMEYRFTGQQRAEAAGAVTRSLAELR